MPCGDEPAEPDRGAIQRSEWEAVMVALDGVVDAAQAVKPRLSSQLDEDQRDIGRLEDQFNETRTSLIRICVGALAVVLALWAIWLAADTLPSWSMELILVVLSVTAGVAGSGIAALTSLLDRHASGLELSDGRRTPVSERKDRFSARMNPWFLARPVLGAGAGLLAFGGSEFFNFVASETPGQVAFIGFLAGLFAKTLFVRLKAVFESVFGN